MQTRAEQVAGIKADQQFWRDLAAEVGPERYGEPGAMGEWTFGDLAGHLLGWRNRTIVRLEAAARGEPDPLADEPEGDDEVDAVNDTIRANDAGRPPAELIDAYADSYDRLIRALDALPDSMLADPKALPFVGGALIDVPFTGHLHEEHVPDLRTWLDEQRGA
jgi:uncharacterized protein (TIGR03083 family)